MPPPTPLRTSNTNSDMQQHTALSLDYEGDATRMPKQPLKPWRRMAVSQVARHRSCSQDSKWICLYSKRRDVYKYTILRF